MPTGNGCEPGAPEAPPENAADPWAGLSADAKLETEAMLREDLAAPRDPSDGGGRAWRVVAADEAPHVAGSRERIEIVFETGPMGIAKGGAVFLQPSPFWEWETPQASLPDAPGFTEVRDVPEGVEIEVDDGTAGMLIAWVDGRALEPGETLRFVYGAGPLGAGIDRYAEEQTPLYLAVDGNGDGIRAFIADSPRMDIVGGPPREIRLILPTTASPGETVRLTVSALDDRGSLSPVASGTLKIVGPPGGLRVPGEIELGGSPGGHSSVEVTAVEPGVYRLEATGQGELEGLHAVSNPVWVGEGLPRIAWGDLHGHSQLSDGTGTPMQYFAYARDVAGLDVAALTDHDHWGMEALDQRPAFWDQIRQAVAAFDEPGRFVTLLGYEWTSWLHGHRHVLYFGEEGEVYSSMDPRYETPDALWKALRGQAALTFAHHSAGGPVSTNWLYPPDPELEPLTEIVSVHGSSEAPDSPLPIYDPVPGNYVRDALDAGYRLGFLGSGDSHDGHPGLHRKGASAGLAGIFTRELTRAGVLEALRARRVYATNGPRIFLSVDLDGMAMGSVFEAPGDDAPGTQQLRVRVVAPEPIAAVDLVRSGVSLRIPVEGETEWTLDRAIPALGQGEYHYVRVITADEGAAWSSPIFAR
ncbi:MAG: CehA/McbA family metallohydrolase [Myxococcota bacterium]|nr:CehA/McbA family metallohydrolase [Myxococcota bacterium]